MELLGEAKFAMQRREGGGQLHVRIHHYLPQVYKLAILQAGRAAAAGAPLQPRLLAAHEHLPTLAMRSHAATSKPLGVRSKSLKRYLLPQVRCRQATSSYT